MNSFWINVYPPIKESELPIVRKFISEAEALYGRLEGCVGTYEIFTESPLGNTTMDSL